MNAEEKESFIRQTAQCRDQIDWTLHAVREAFDYNFRQQDVEIGLLNAVLIEDYPTIGRKLPDCLVLGMTLLGRAFHAVVAIDQDSDRIVIVTVYEPDSEVWENDFKTRIKK